MAIIGVGIYSTEAGGYKVFDSHARNMCHNFHSEGTCVALEIPSMQKLVQYFQTLHRNEDIYYIDTSVLLENIPLVKFIKSTSGTRVVYFP